MQTHDRSIADEATKTALPARLSAPQRRPACRRKKPMSHHHQKVSPAQKASVQHAAVIGQSLVASAVTSEESGVTDAAARTIFESPHLQQLVYLNLCTNKIGRSAEVLARPDIMPKLAHCMLVFNPIPQTCVDRISGRAGLEI